MKVSIMLEPAVTVDVRDMLCAQALAVVAQQLARLTAGGRAAIPYNTDDVKHDLIAWANDRGHHVDAATPGTLQITVGYR